MPTKIEWTDESWNPVTGCTKVSPGCKNCYGEAIAKRFWANQYPRVMPDDPLPQLRPRVFTDVQCHPERLDQPLRWRKPRQVFVCSMSDLFHEAVPIAFLAEVFDVMACATVECGKRHEHEAECWTGKPHQFQLLTKRPGRMREVISTELCHWSAEHMPGDSALSLAFEAESWPLPNVHLGVSAENQEMLDLRVPDLLATPAARRFVSLEPLLGPVDLTPGFVTAYESWVEGHPESPNPRWPGGFSRKSPSVDRVIVGGESGPNARPCDVEWIRSVVEQCRAAGVACFVKQLGSLALLPNAQGTTVYERGQESLRLDAEWPEGTRFGNPTGIQKFHGRVIRLRHPKGGDPAEWPEDLRVREEMPV